MANPITQVLDTITQAPAPNTLQQTGVMISVGGTTTAANTLTLLTTSASLATILAGALAVTSITQTTGTATVTTTAPHGIPTGEAVEVTIAGASPAAYNGTFLATSTGTSAFTYTVTGSPSSPATGTIKYTLEDVAELMAMNTTFFAQNGIKAVYVLELGILDSADAITALGTWITNNPGRVYSYLTPFEWDALTGFLTLLKNYVANNARTYFWVTTTTANEAFYAGLKCVVAFVPAPAAASTEFLASAPFSLTLGWQPSSSQQVPPLQYNFLSGVTAWPPFGNSTTFAGFSTNKINYPLVASEGGLSNVMLVGGKTQDGNPFNFWYSVDWVSINADLVVSNVVINGSNAVPYLYYNQPGINRLQNALKTLMSSAVAYGLALGTVVTTQLAFQDFANNVANGVYDGQCVVNAEPFAVYTAENPSDYSIGKYGGLSIGYSPGEGFDMIVVNVNASTFA